MRWPLRLQIMLPMAAIMLLTVLVVGGLGRVSGRTGHQGANRFAGRRGDANPGGIQFSADRCRAAADEGPVGCRNGARGRRRQDGFHQRSGPTIRCASSRRATGGRPIDSLWRSHLGPRSTVLSHGRCTLTVGAGQPRLEFCIFSIPSSNIAGHGNSAVYPSLGFVALALRL